MRKMFCSKCGKKNDEDAKFCSYCGEEIVDTQPEEVSLDQFLMNRVEVFLKGDARRGSVAAKGFLLRHRKAVAVCAVALIILIGGVSVVRGLFNPERSAVSFFESYMNQDWAAVYQEIYLPEGAMLDETHFLQLAEEWETPEYLDYQVEQLSRGDEDSLYLDYRFTYSTPGSSAPSQMDVTLVRTGKAALIFDTYQVSMEGLVAENCTVTIPNGATLLLNGEALETESTVEGMRQICQLPQLFAGTYTIGLQHPVYECADIIEYINSGVSFDLMNECTVEASNMQDAAYGDVTGYLSNIFESALSGGTLDRTGVPVASGWESAASDNFRDFQQNCESYVERRGVFQLTNVELDSVYLDTSDGAVDCDFSYECLRQGLEPTDQPSTFSGSAEMTVAFLDGAWQLESFRVSNIY
jgi:hypothetical protein